MDPELTDPQPTYPGGQAQIPAGPQMQPPAAQGGSQSNALLDYLQSPAYHELEHANVQERQSAREDNRAAFNSLGRDYDRVQQRPVPQLEKVPEAPPQQLGKGLMEFMQLATVLGALAGGKTRTGATAALNAFGAAVKGFAQGNREEFQANAETWKMETQKVLDDNQAKLDAYNAELKKDQVGMDIKLAMVKIQAAEHKDEMAFHLAEMQRPIELAGLIQKQEEMQQRLSENFVKTQAQVNLINEHTKVLQQQQTANYLDAAKRYVMGDQSARTQVAGRGQAANAQWNDAVQQAQKELGLSNEDIMANQVAFAGRKREAMTIANRAGSITVAANEVARLLPQVQAASRASPGTGTAVWNTISNKWDVQTGDPAYQKMVTQMNAMLASYGTVLARGGASTDASRALARENLNPNMPQKAREAAMQAIVADINAGRQAILDAREELRTGQYRPIQMEPAGNAGSMEGQWSIEP